MEKELTKIFQKAKYNEISGLNKNIWENIAIYDKHILRLKLWIFSSVGIASLAGLIPVLKNLSSEITQSGLYEYLSLLFSNNDSITYYWKELALSIAESLPTMSIVLSLSLIFTLLLSLKFIARQIIKSAYLDSRPDSGQLSFS